MTHHPTRIFYRLLMPHIGSTRHMLTLSVSRHLESTPMREHAENRMHIIKVVFVASLT